MENKIYIDWNEYGLLLVKLVQKIKQGGEKYVGVFGIPRGGQIIAVYISHHLKIPVLKKPKPKCIIVDDISDSGRTLLLKKYNGYTCACLYSTWWTKKNPDFFVDEKRSKGDWLIFPYEVGENE